jgi:hypothetical protein
MFFPKIKIFVHITAKDWMMIGFNPGHPSSLFHFGSRFGFQFGLRSIVFLEKPGEPVSAPTPGTGSTPKRPHLRKSRSNSLWRMQRIFSSF